MKKILLTVFTITALAFTLNARTYTLTLEQSIELAKEKSNRMQTLLLDKEMAEYNLRSTISRYRTHINFDLTLPKYDDNVEQWSDSTGVSFYSAKSLNLSGALTVRQPLPTDGEIYVTTWMNNTEDYYRKFRTSYFSTRVGFRQPLDAFWGYNNYTSTMKNARLEFERANKSLYRAELNLVYDVSRAYYDLLSFQRSMEIAHVDLERQQSITEISRKKFEAGLLREVEVLQIEVDLAQAQSDYDMSLLNQSAAINSFKELLGIELDDEIELDNDLSYKEVDVDPEMAVAYALENRLEIRENEIQIEMGKLNLRQQRARGLPQAYLQAYYEKTGVSRDRFGTKYYMMLNHSFSNFSDRPSSYGVGLTISIPILDWGESKNAVRAAETRLKRSMVDKEDTERQIETEVRNLVSKINMNLRMLELLEKNVEIAEKSFDITLKRFEDGDIDSENLALDRIRLNRAYNSHLSAYIDYKLSLADIMRKTFYDFEKNIELDNGGDMGLNKRDRRK